MDLLDLGWMLGMLAGAVGLIVVGLAAIGLWEDLRQRRRWRR